MEVLIRCQYSKMIPVEELIPHPKNRNKHPQEQIERLSKIILYQGFRIPIKVSNNSGHITSGHGRLMAALALGMEAVPVDFQDYESEEMEYADVQADNAIALWAELDLSGINEDIGPLGPDLDLDMLGIEDFTVCPSEKGGGGGGGGSADGQSFSIEISCVDLMHCQDISEELKIREIKHKIKVR